MLTAFVDGWYVTDERGGKHAQMRWRVRDCDSVTHTRKLKGGGGQPGSPTPLLFCAAVRQVLLQPVRRNPPGRALRHRQGTSRPNADKHSRKRKPSKQNPHAALHV